MARRILRIVLASSLVAFGASSAHASPLFELAGGTLGQGGFNGRVTGASASSAYFNPALLTSSAQEFDVGVVLLSDQISLTLDGRPGGDVPQVIGDRAAFDPRTNEPIPNDTVPTDWLQNGCATSACTGSAMKPRPRQRAGTSAVTRAYTAIGLVSHILDPWLVLGLHALVPIGGFTQIGSFYNDEREQFFSNSLHPELYSDRLTATSLAFGAASRVTDRLSIGLSFTLSLTNNARAATYVRDPVDYQKLLLDNKVGVETAVAPHVGVNYDPTDRLHLAATFHSEQKLVLVTGVSATLPSGTESQTTLREVHDFVPWTLALGGAFDINPKATNAFSVAWTTAYEGWSDYVDRHGNRPDFYGRGSAWKDTWNASVGVRHVHGKQRSFLDFAFRPSPAPLQTGRANYVDNDRLGATIGTDYETSVAGHRMRFGVSAQAQRLLHRYQAKDDSLIRDEAPDGAVDKNQNPVPGTSGLQTNNPGWPGFASDGYVFGASVWASLIY